MNYYQLTDALRAGQIIRVDGRKHYRFAFGTYRWERTTIFQAYLTQGTAFYEKYCIITQEQAQKYLMANGKRLAELLRKADQIAAAAYGRRPEHLAHLRNVAEELLDWEEKIAAMLMDISSAGITIRQLHEAGFPPFLCLAVDLLQPTNEDHGEYLRKLRANRIARNVKLMELSEGTQLPTGREPTAQERAYAQTCVAARRFLYGDVAEFTRPG